MTYQVLSRKLRPHNFDQVIGQDHVVQSLRNALVQKRIGHAYLFTGTRGVGKTTLARIFAKTLRCMNLQEDGNPCPKAEQCLPCQEFDHQSCLDITEIDGASHNGVEHIRQLIENIHYMPITGARKIYIIDEVHMLSKEAFNALLKTLEAPPQHVFFIFATTLPEKLIDTVLSRCQRFDLRSLTTKVIGQFLQQVAQNEKLSIQDQEGLMLLAHEAQGSMRDSLTLLEQVISFLGNEPLTLQAVEDSLGLVRTKGIQNLLQYMLQGNIAELSQTYRRFLSENADIKRLALKIINELYTTIQEQSWPEEVTQSEIFWIFETLTQDLNWAVTSMASDKVVEIILQKITLRRTFFLSEDKANETSSAPKEKKTQILSEKAPAPKWDQFIRSLYGEMPSLATILEHGNFLTPFKTDGPTLKVHLGFPEKNQLFYQSLQRPAEKERLEKKLSEYFSFPISTISLDFEVINLRGNDGPFQSRIEIQQENQKNALVQKREALAGHELVEKAKNLFKAKIDNISV